MQLNSYNSSYIPCWIKSIKCSKYHPCTN